MFRLISVYPSKTYQTVYQTASLWNQQSIYKLLQMCRWLAVQQFEASTPTVDHKRTVLCSGLIRSNKFLLQIWHHKICKLFLIMPLSTNCLLNSYSRFLVISSRSVMTHVILINRRVGFSSPWYTLTTRYSLTKHSKQLCPSVWVKHLHLLSPVSDHLRLITISDMPYMCNLALYWCNPIMRHTQMLSTTLNTDYVNLLPLLDKRRGTT